MYVSSLGNGTTLVVEGLCKSYGPLAALTDVSLSVHDGEIGRSSSERYGEQEVSQFRSAEMIAQRWAIEREEMEVYALDSHRRAIAANEEGLVGLGAEQRS